MKEFINLCYKWMNNDVLVYKQIKIDSRNFNIMIKNKEGVIIEGGFFIGKSKNLVEDEFLILVENLIRYDEQSNLSF